MADGKRWHNFRIEVFCDASVPPAEHRIEFYRGYVPCDPSGNQTGDECQNTGVILRHRAAEIIGKSWKTKSGKVVTGAELLELLEAAGDDLHNDKIEVEAKTAKEVEGTVSTSL
jgi:hypothetical protein